MRIELCEDNALLSAEGKPTLVILVITKDDGKQIRVPYQANKKISDLYVDARALAVNNDIKEIEDFVSAPVQSKTENPVGVSRKDSVGSVLSPIIGREDIVTCVRKEKDLDGNVNEEIEVGRQYRVIDIIKQGKQVNYYEVMDDAKGDRLRIAVFPTEIELTKKFVKKDPPRKQVYEETKTCVCGEIISLLLDGDLYVGTCESCNATMSQKREKKNA